MRVLIIKLTSMGDLMHALPALTDAVKAIPDIEFDWVVDKKKYPDGLHPLIKHINSLGMSFGLWFEPEMVSPDSDLYRRHPEWIMGHKDQTLGRDQLVLNISIKDVEDYLFEKISALLAEYPIEYIKWDHNRVLPFPDASQTNSLYLSLIHI